MKRLALWVPLALFVVFLVTVASGLLKPSDPRIQSRLIGQPVPELALEPMLPGRPGLQAADLRSGQPRLLNIFASWCIPCRGEAPQLMELKRRGVPIDAIAVRDKPEDVSAFLADHGDPFQRIGSDPQLKVQMALGSSGVPETFVIDGKGIIRHQHIGDIRPEHLPQIIAAYEAAR